MIKLGNYKNNNKKKNYIICLLTSITEKARSTLRRETPVCRLMQSLFIENKFGDREAFISMLYISFLWIHFIMSWM